MLGQILFKFGYILAKFYLNLCLKLIIDNAAFERIIHNIKTRIFYFIYTNYNVFNETSLISSETSLKTKFTNISN